MTIEFPANLLAHNVANLPRGWRIDRDEWLWRLLQPGDATREYWSGERANHGFIDGRRVFTRSAELAQEFDAAGK